MNIWYGSRENDKLSNLSFRPFLDKDGRGYVSVEHAYQSWKSGRFDRITYDMPWKRGSKFVGKLGVKTKGNWNLRLMKALIKASFLDERNFVDLSILIDSYPKVLTHTQDKGIWRTEFPKILMEIREEIRVTNGG